MFTDLGPEILSIFRFLMPRLVKQKTAPCVAARGRFSSLLRRRAEINGSCCKEQLVLHRRHCIHRKVRQLHNHRSLAQRLGP